MSNAHRHRKITGQCLARSWRGCVNPAKCKGIAHGGITFTDKCACGATRETESNAGVVVVGSWVRVEATR